MWVEKKIMMERLKQGIAYKLQLSPHQFVNNLLYRHPISLCSTQYRACKLEDDDDIQLMWETNSWFPTQLSSIEIYANIRSRELDFNIGNLPIVNHLLSLVHYTEHLCGSNGLTSLFNTYQTEDNTFTPRPTHM